MVYRGLQRPSARTAAGRARDQPPVRQAHRNGYWNARRKWPAAGRPGSTQQHAVRVDGDRTTNKNPIRGWRTGLHAITRFRFGEERCVPERSAFRRGQDANVHRFVVPGGGPFFTACCRDCFTHSLPQETSAGRNLITVFLPVNNLMHFFSPPVHGRNSAPGGRAHRRCACTPPALDQRLCLHARKVLIFRHFPATNECVRMSGDAMPCVQRNFRMGQQPGFTCPFAGSNGSVVFASHKPICAKLRENFPAPKAAHRCRCERRAGKNPRRFRRGFYFSAVAMRAPQWSSSSSSSA